ncbi:hypothetical protein D3C87_1334820 [compost metagenome]
MLGRCFNRSGFRRVAIVSVCFVGIGFSFHHLGHLIIEGLKAFASIATRPGLKKLCRHAVQNICINQTAATKASCRDRSDVTFGIVANFHQAIFLLARIPEHILANFFGAAREFMHFPLATTFQQANLVTFFRQTTSHNRATKARTDHDIIKIKIHATSPTKRNLGCCCSEFIFAAAEGAWTFRNSRIFGKTSV